MNNYRYEIKFILNEVSYSDAMQWLYVCTNAINKYPDRYVNTIYLDNSSYDSVRDNLSGVSDRFKRRIRWYDGNSEIKIEKKVRHGRLGKKEASILDLGGDFSSALSALDLRNRINDSLYNKEALFSDYYTPVLGVRYLRKYFEDQAGFRVTFDEKIQFSDLYDNSTSFSLSNELIDYEPKVMEIKFNPSVKDYMNTLISKLNMTTKRHSKYLVGMACLGNVVYF